MLFILLIISNTVSSIENNKENLIKEQGSSLTIRTLTCPKGCFLQNTLYFKLPKEDYPKDYRLPYELKQKEDNCGLFSFIYYKPTGKHWIYVYPKDKHYLLDGFLEEGSCSFTEKEGHEGNKIICTNHFDEITFKTIREP